MKRIRLTFIVFIAWFFIASSYYTCVIKGLCKDNSTSSMFTNTDVNTFQKLDTKPIKNAIKVDSTITIIKKNEDSLIMKTAPVFFQMDSLSAGILSIYNNDTLVYRFNDNFKIYKNKKRVQITTAITRYGLELANYMDTNNLNLIISGYYHHQEEDSILGIQRALYIKERLKKLSINEQYMSINSKKAFFEYSKYNTFKGGINFSFIPSDSVISLNIINYDTPTTIKKEQITIEHSEILSIDTIPKVLDSVKSIKKNPSIQTPPILIKPKIKIEPKTKALHTVSSVYFKNNKFRASSSLKKFIKQHKKDQPFLLIGFSNQNINALDNYNQGIHLAELLKKYLVKKEIPITVIRTSALKNITNNTNANLNEGVTIKIL